MIETIESIESIEIYWMIETIESIERIETIEWLHDWMIQFESIEMIKVLHVDWLHWKYWKYWWIDMLHWKYRNSFGNIPIPGEGDGWPSWVNHTNKQTDRQTDKQTDRHDLNRGVLGDSPAMEYTACPGRTITHLKYPTRTSEVGIRGGQNRLTRQDRTEADQLSSRGSSYPGHARRRHVLTL